MNHTIYDIEQWAAARNITTGGSTDTAQLLKAMSEMGELADALLKNDKEGIKDGIGDVIVCLSNLANIRETNLAECTAAAYEEIKDRKGVMYNGAFIKEDDPRYLEIMKELIR